MLESKIGEKMRKNLKTKARALSNFANTTISDVNAFVWYFQN